MNIRYPTTIHFHFYAKTISDKSVKITSFVFRERAVLKFNIYCQPISHQNYLFISFWDWMYVSISLLNIWKILTMFDICRLILIKLNWLMSFVFYLPPILQLFHIHLSIWHKSQKIIKYGLITVFLCNPARTVRLGMSYRFLCWAMQFKETVHKSPHLLKPTVVTQWKTLKEKPIKDQAIFHQTS